MKYFTSAIFILIALSAVAGPVEQGVAVAENVPAPQTSSGPWWPSRWGAGDQLGALNHLNPQKVLEALTLVKKGQVLDMAHPFEMGRPDFHHRTYNLISAGSPSKGPVGSERFMFNEEWLAGEITGMSTQFDALVHLGKQLGENGDNRTVYYYNGFTQSDIGTANGFKKLGVENVTPIFTKGVLIDLAAYKGAVLNGNETITVADLKGALRYQGMSEKDIRPGDVVFYRLGRDQLWYDDPESYVRTTAGLNKAAADWLASLDILAIGADSFALEPIPPKNDRLAEIHATFLLYNGIYMFENLDLRGLAKAAVYQFAFSFAPIPFVGAQGSPARPFALY